MLCESCKKKQATIHYFESIDGKARTLNLCESCAELKGIGVNLSAISFEAFMKLAPEMHIQSKPKAPTGKICMGYGMTYVDFKHNPSQACPACLDTFLSRDELIKRGRKFIEKHEASAPKQLSNSEAFAQESDNRVEGLRRLMQRAIELEEFEEAARLRDLIKETKGVTKA
jgi:protein arginine kinase activator